MVVIWEKGIINMDMAGGGDGGMQWCLQLALKLSK